MGMTIIGFQNYGIFFSDVFVSFVCMVSYINIKKIKLNLGVIHL